MVSSKSSTNYSSSFSTARTI